MWKKNIKIAYRILIRHKAFSFINIIGLSLGIGACLLILNFVLFEFSFDRFHAKSNEIFRITSVADDSQNRSIMSPPLLGPELKRNYTEVIQSARLILPWSGQAAASTLGRLDEGKTAVKKIPENSFKNDKVFVHT